MPKSTSRDDGDSHIPEVIVDHSSFLVVAELVSALAYERQRQALPLPDVPGDRVKVA